MITYCYRPLLDKLKVTKELFELTRTSIIIYHMMCST